MGGGVEKEGEFGGGGVDEEWVEGDVGGDKGVGGDEFDGVGEGVF